MARLALLLACLVTFSTRALEPPTQEQLEKYRAEGTLDEYLASARALGNHRIDPALVLEFQRRVLPSADAGEMQPAPPSGIRQGLRSKGVNRIFAILIEFPEYPAMEPVQTLDAALFGDGLPSDVPYESLRNYYRRSSYNQLEIQGSTLGYYRSPDPRASVPHTQEGREQLIRKALLHFDERGHDFSQYDNDGDGSIDYFCVFWTGPTEDGPIFWWGSYIGGWSSPFSLDGKSFSRATLSWQEIVNVRGNMTRFVPRVVIHETGHALGLPDLYDYDSSVGPGGGVGGLDVMGGSGDHNAFSKMMLGWLDPVVARNGATYALAPSGTSPQAVIVWPAHSTARPFTEFFVVQNRMRVGNDAVWDWPADGLLIWHVDARLSEWGTFVYDNSYTDHKLVRLMEADGLEEIQASPYQNAADAGDFYVPGRTFGPATRPDSNAYDGSVTGVAVTQIQRMGASFTFEAGVKVYAKRRTARP